MCVGNTHPWETYIRVTPVRFWPYQFSLVLMKKPGKKQIKSVIHSITCKNGELFFGFFNSTVWFARNSVGASVASPVIFLKRAFGKTKASKLRRRWFTDCFNLVCMAHPDSIPLRALLDALTWWGYARLVSTNVFVRAVKDVVNCHTCITGFKEG